MNTPNPGSNEAQCDGCICPVLDNGRGKGYLGGMKDDDGNTLFVIVVGCPLHSPNAVGVSASPEGTDAA
jgi:hypothetical protein